MNEAGNTDQYQSAGGVEEYELREEHFFSPDEGYSTPPEEFAGRLTPELHERGRQLPICRGARGRAWKGRGWITRRQLPGRGSASFTHNGERRFTGWQLPGSALAAGP